MLLEGLSPRQALFTSQFLPNRATDYVKPLLVFYFFLFDGKKVPRDSSHLYFPSIFHLNICLNYFYKRFFKNILLLINVDKIIRFI